MVGRTPVSFMKRSDHSRVSSFMSQYQPVVSWMPWAVLAPSACTSVRNNSRAARVCPAWVTPNSRSEEHTSELQSRENLVCRLLLEKKKVEEQIEDLARLRCTTFE